MQTLGLSTSTPRTESRWKALLWPTIRNDGDFDYITEQGFWVCCIVALITLVFSVFKGWIFLGLFESLFFFLAGVGVRERSRIASNVAFAAYLLGILVRLRYIGQGFGIVPIIFLALLLTNIRGNWLSSRWKKDAEVELTPSRLNQTIFDKFSDQLPALLWPKARWVFYFMAAVEIFLLLISLTTPLPPRSSV